MKVYLNDLEIQKVYNLNYENTPTASFYLYTDILPEVLKYKNGKIFGTIDDVWKGQLPFNRVCDNSGNVVWEWCA